jgi:hypothetical protein
MDSRRLLLGLIGTAALVAALMPNTSATTLPDLDGEVFSVATISSDDAWAVGYQRDADHPGEATLTQHWDGNSWTVVPSASDGSWSQSLEDVAAVSSSDVWAVGTGDGPLTEHWDGTSWSVVPTPDPTPAYESWIRLESIAAIAPGDVWAVGSYEVGLDEPQMLVEHWDGAAWSVVATPDRPRFSQQLYGVSASSANDAWAVGVSGIRSLIEHWDGTSWRTVPNHVPDSAYVYLRSVAAVNGSDAWAIGNTGLGGPSSFIEHWDGSSWSLVPVSDQVAHAGLLADISAVSSNDVWAVGGPEYGAEALIEHWDGWRWTVDQTLELPTKPGGLRGVSAVPGAAWAVGSYYDSTGEVLRPVVAERHRGTWQLLGPRAPVLHRASIRVTTSVRTAQAGDRVTFAAHATNDDNRTANVWVDYRDAHGFVVRREVCVDGPSADSPSCEFSHIPAHDTVVVKVRGRIKGAGDDATLTFCAFLADRPVRSCKTGSIRIAA